MFQMDPFNEVVYFLKYSGVPFGADLGGYEQGLYAEKWAQFVKVCHIFYMIC